MKHELKSLPEYFEPVWFDEKTFEIRRNDRGFAVKDEIVLREWEPPPPTLHFAQMAEGEYTGREIDAVIVYMTDFNQMPGYVVFGFEIKAFRQEKGRGSQNELA